MRPVRGPRSRVSPLLPVLLAASAACGDATPGPGVEGQQAPSGASDAVADADAGSTAPGAEVDLAMQAAPEAWFRDEARARGLDFVYHSGHGERYWFPEIVGGGAALLDADGDGDLDAYLVQAGRIDGPPEEREPNRLFANDGHGMFTDVTAASGGADRGYGMGVAAGDVDRDGDVDLYVTNVGQNVLLENLSETGTTPWFRDVTRDSGVEEPAWSSSASFFDYDEDGLLDLFVANYVFWSMESERTCIQPTFGPDYCSPNSYDAPAPDSLFRNRGGMRFDDVSSAAGIRAAYGNGLGCVTADFDGDGWTDLFVANDGRENQLWMNKGGERFVDESRQRGVGVDDDGKKKAGMGTAAVDIDDDGDEDLIVVNLVTESDSLYENRGRYFKDSGVRYGLGVVTKGYTRWGVGFRDFDDDGWLDLFEANGRVERPADFERDRPYEQPNVLLRGHAGERYFAEVEPQGGSVEELVNTSRAAAFGDIDDDGGVDILVVNRDAPAELLRNVRQGRGGWLLVRVVDAAGSDALGVRLEARLGERTLTRIVRTDGSYCAASDPRVHLGLGSAARVDDLVVTWLDGTREDFGPRDADQVVTLVRGSGR